MKHRLLFWFLLCGMLSAKAQLKYVIYDFDGLNLGQTDLPDGDYKNNDLVYSITASPLAPSDVIGDRVLQLDLNWQTGSGEFGKTMNRFLQLNQGADHLNFYIYNPVSNGDAANVFVTLTEDDNQDNTYEAAMDDKWVAGATVPAGAGWQLVSIPLSSFQASGGNGFFDVGYTGNGGMIFGVGLVFSHPSPSSASDRYYIDMLSFSDGALPTGNSILDLPSKNPGDYCRLGALCDNTHPDQTPADIEGICNTGKKLSFVNWFTFYSTTGTTPNDYTGTEVQSLLDGGYRPVITWEMMYDSYPRLDPVQPRLGKIIDGTFDSYIDTYATKIKSYNDTVIMRIFHEFEGNWYCWSLTENNQDPNLYISAFRHVVDRFRNIGATKVKWMWCLNAEPEPYSRYNWVVSCYPGDAYVDIVATDIYNHPNTGIPDWKSFRYTTAESYYYLHKYFPNKPLYICEVGCRERDASEPASSQTKADWMCEMNKELQSYFSETRALIFFSMPKEHDWRVNSSQASTDAFKSCFWTESYYGQAVGFEELAMHADGGVYPNPFADEIILTAGRYPTSSCSFKLYNMSGQLVLSCETAASAGKIDSRGLSAGMYIAEINDGLTTRNVKMVKAGD